MQLFSLHFTGHGGAGKVSEQGLLVIRTRSEKKNFSVWVTGNDPGGLR